MLRQIQQQLGSLSKAEHAVATWVLAHPRQAAEAKLAEVASECRVSEPTVIRFCRHVGLDGFRDLTLRLVEALSQPASYLHRDVTADDATQDAFAKVLDASIQTLIETRSRLAVMPIAEAVEALRNARQIVFTGLGASGHVAADACQKFFRLGIPSSALTDSPGILQFSAIAGAGDVLVFVSTRGAWSESLQAASHALARGACVIALTDPRSALASCASIVLPGEPTEDTSVFTPMSSRLAQLALLDALHVSLALSLGETAASNLRASKEIILTRISG